MLTLLTEESLSPGIAEAQALQRVGEWEAAETIYYALLAKRPADPLLLYYLGALYSRMGNDYAAAEVLRHAVNQKPDFAPACWELAEALRSLGDSEEANNVYRHAIHLDSDEAASPAHFGVAVAPLRNEAIAGRRSG